MPLAPVAAAAALAASAAYKLVYQPLMDALGEDFGYGTEFPPRFRKKLIAQHILLHGCRCLMCNRRVARSDFDVDHIVPMAQSGRTSSQNAQVICWQCNTRKGARCTPWDLFRGRR